MNKNDQTAQAMLLLPVTTDQLESLITASVIKALKAEKELESRTKIMTVIEISQRLKVAPNTIKKWIREGDLKTTVNGKITQENFNDFLSNSYKR